MTNDDDYYRSIDEPQTLSIVLMKLIITDDIEGANALVAGLERVEIEQMLLSQARWSAHNLIQHYGGDKPAAAHEANRWASMATTALAQQAAASGDPDE